MQNGSLKTNANLKKLCHRNLISEDELNNIYIK